MHKLSFVDHIFLLLENQKQPMHLAGVCIFELPENAPANFIDTLINDMQPATNPAKFPFNQRLYRHFFWQEDANFQITQHFFHKKLPENSDLQTLLTHISQDHSRMMDKTKPLWEFHLIEGIAPESMGRPMRFAVYLKIHHTMADGVAIMRLLQMSLDSSPTAKLASPFWALTHKKPKQAVPKKTSTFGQLKSSIFDIKPVLTELKNRFDDRHLEEFTSSFDAPKSILNQRLSTARKIVAQSFDKQRFEQIAQVFQVTTNDVLLAVCSFALRQYLLSQNQLPKKPLIAFVPVSLRKDKSIHGNQLSFLLTNLGTHLDDSLERLNTIHQSMTDGKKRFSRMNPRQVIAYSAMIYGLCGINLATGLYPAKQAFNLIISNVPGEKTPLYLNGAPLKAIYPASVLLDGQALNITIANYQDKVDFGIVACDTALPNIERLITGIESELLTLETLAKLS